jgi:Phycobilisome degradation protein nblA
MHKLTVEQEFFVQKIKLGAKGKTKEQLEKDIIDLTIMMIKKDNMYREMLLTGAGII